MDDIRKTLKTRVNNLDRLIDIKRNAVARAPEGNMKIDRTRGIPHYYLVKEDGSKIALTESEAHIYAQKAYDSKIIKSATKERDFLNSTLTLYPGNCVEEIIGSYGDNRRRLIVPVRQSDQEYIDKWINADYKQKIYSSDNASYKTKKGDLVRSKSELIIADKLFDLGIPYRYEAELRLGYDVIHPDFTILDVKNRREVYLEHFGMMDDPEYVSKNMWRLNLYSDHNILLGDKLYLTMETKDYPLNIDNLDKILSWFVYRVDQMS